jgi:protein TonB
MAALTYSHYDSHCNESDACPKSLVTAKRLHLAVLVSVLLHVFILIAEDTPNTNNVTLPSFIDVQLGVEPAANRQQPVVRPQNSGKTSASPEPVAKQQTGMPLVEARYDVSELKNPRPTYPLVARKRGYQGRVVLRAFVTTAGECGDVKLVKTSGYKALDNAAITAVREWRFMPAHQDGEIKASWIEIPINFRLKS